MTLPASPNSISLSQVNVELGLSATAQISMNDTIVRTLFGVGGSGTQIDMSSGRGKANKFVATISSDQTNLDLRAWLVSAGWDQAVAVEVTNDVNIYATSTSVYAMSIAGSFPNGLTFINNGNIIGKGGNGDGGSYTHLLPNCAVSVYTGVATSGGPAMYVATSVTFTNNGTTGGGGGGGGSGAYGDFFRPPGACAQAPTLAFSAGGGGGGGAGYGNGGQYNALIQGQGEGVVTLLCVGVGSKAASYNGAGGSLVSPGGGGAGGGPGNSPCNTIVYGGAGGSGGTLGATGSTGATSSTGYVGSGGGAGGAAIVGNGYISWNATGARYGSIS